MLNKHHNNQWDILWHSRQTNRIPHALLFIGKNNIGKQEFANTLGKALLCVTPTNQGFACGQCRSCHLVIAGSHPDLMQVQPLEKKTIISIDQIREVVTFVNETPQQGGWRVIIINPAGAMNVNAANALLKTLEEPTPNTTLILINDENLRLPATIISRCQRMLFRQPLAEIALLPAIHEAHTAVISGIYAIFQKKADPLGLAVKWQEMDILTIIDALFACVRDLLRFKLTHDPAYLLNSQFQAEISHLSQAINRDNLLAYVDLLQDARKESVSPINLNKQLLLEKLLIQWTRYVFS